MHLFYFFLFPLLVLALSSPQDQSSMTSDIAATPTTSAPIPTVDPANDHGWNLITPEILAEVGGALDEVSSDGLGIINYYWKCETSMGSPYTWDVEAISKVLPYYARTRKIRNTKCIQWEKEQWACTHVMRFASASVALCGGYKKKSDIGCKNIALLVGVIASKCNRNGRAGGWLRVVPNPPKYDMFDIPVFHS